LNDQLEQSSADADDSASASSAARLEHIVEFFQL